MFIFFKIKIMAKNTFVFWQSEILISSHAIHIKNVIAFGKDYSTGTFLCITQGDSAPFLTIDPPRLLIFFLTSRNIFPDLVSYYILSYIIMISILFLIVTFTIIAILIDNYYAVCMINKYILGHFPYNFVPKGSLGLVKAANRAD
jgi:hypothetical protein